MAAVPLPLYPEKGGRAKNLPDARYSSTSDPDFPLRTARRASRFALRKVPDGVTYARFRVIFPGSSSPGVVSPLESKRESLILRITAAALNIPR